MGIVIKLLKERRIGNFSPPKKDGVSLPDEIMNLSKHNLEEIRMLFEQIKEENFNEDSFRKFLFDILKIEAREPSFLKTTTFLYVLSIKKFTSQEKLVNDIKKYIDNFMKLNKIERQIVRYLFLYKKEEPKYEDLFAIFVKNTTSKTSLSRKIFENNHKYKRFFYAALKKWKHLIRKLHLLKAERMLISFNVFKKIEK